MPLEEYRPGGISSGRAPGCERAGKHLRGVPASRQEATLKRYWRAWPSANVGLPTGPENGLVVLDIDRPEGGLPSLRALEERHGRLPETYEVRTGGGGIHFYFLHPGSTIASRNGWRPGIDIRGDGGYVVAPPSLHPSGRRYVFSRIPPTLQPARMPEWLVGRLGSSSSVGRPA